MLCSCEVRVCVSVCDRVCSVPVCCCNGPLRLCSKFRRRCSCVSVLVCICVKLLPRSCEVLACHCPSRRCSREVLSWRCVKVRCSTSASWLCNWSVVICACVACVGVCVSVIWVVIFCCFHGPPSSCGRTSSPGPSWSPTAVVPSHWKPAPWFQ
ncbi:MAG: hypothetical protein AW07_02108 [Candidatus Accumulibacter sp. SK-11]|nr:MAG: hypothetical protein AW07_02108 [Candidatus Accumulibacter sp. SK-11]